MEQWKDVPGYGGRYRVSDRGNVTGAKGPLVPQMQNSGYLVVHLYLDGNRTISLVHRLVAKAFVCGSFAGAHVNHKNRDKTDNAAANIEWVTRSENVNHAYATGHAGPTRYAVRGVPLVGGKELVFASQVAAEKALCGRASSAIHHCLVGKKKSAYGYVWNRA